MNASDFQDWCVEDLIEEIMKLHARLSYYTGRVQARCAEIDRYRVERKKTIEVEWDEALERELTRRLMSYRALRQALPGSLEQQLSYERHEAREFIKRLLQLFGTRAPVLAGDSDVDAAVARLRSAHDASKDREQVRLGDDFERLYHGKDPQS